MHIIIFFFGAIFGSFFYTLAIRYINGSIKRDRIKALFSTSRCPGCGHRIGALHLIPIFGFFFACGRCKKCGQKISPLYPLFEILYGFLAVLIYNEYGENSTSLLLFLIAGTAVTIALIDLKSLTIPDSLLLTILILSVYPVIQSGSLLDNLYGLLFMAAFFIIILLIFPGSFGGGDVKYAAVIGALLGFELSVVALETGLITGSVAGIIYALKTRKGFRSKIPFAPFLTAGLIIALLYGRDITLIYYRVLF